MTIQKNNSENFTFLGPGMIMVMINYFLVLLLPFAHHYKFIVYLGYFLWLAGVGIWIIAMFALKKYGEIIKGGFQIQTRKLVVAGIYGFLRHPQYMAYMLFDIGFILITGDLIITIISLLSIIFLYLGMKEEDEILLEMYGGEFESYRLRIPMLNPIAGMIVYYRDVIKKK